MVSLKIAAYDRDGHANFGHASPKAFRDSRSTTVITVRTVLYCTIYHIFWHLCDTRKGIMAFRRLNLALVTVSIISAQHFEGTLSYNHSATCNASQATYGLFFSSLTTGTFSLTISEAGFTGSASTSTTADLLGFSTTTTTTSTTTLLPGLRNESRATAFARSLNSKDGAWWGTSTTSTTTESSGVSTTTTSTSSFDVHGSGGSATTTTLSDSMGVVTSTTSTSSLSVTGSGGRAFDNWGAGSAQTTSATGSGGVETTTSTSSTYDYRNSSNVAWLGGFTTDSATGSGPSVTSTSTTGTLFLTPSAATRVSPLPSSDGGAGSWQGPLTVTTFTSSAAVTTATTHTFHVTIGTKQGDSALLQASLGPWSLAALLPGFLPPQLKAGVFSIPTAFSSWVDPAVAQACHDIDIPSLSAHSASGGHTAH